MAARSTALFVVGVAIVLGLVLFGYGRIVSWESQPQAPAQEVDIEPKPAGVPQEPVAPDSPKVASLSAPSGVVELKVGASKWMPAAEGTEILPGMGLRTGADGSATVSYAQGEDTKGISLALEKNSEVHLDRLDDEVARFVVGKGLVVIDVEPDGKRVVQLVADGSDAITETRGGRVAMLNDGKGQVQTAVIEGEAMVEAQGEQVKVQAGEQTLVRPGKAPAKPTKIPKSLLVKVRWPGAGGDAEVATAKKRHRITGKTTPGSLVRIGKTVVSADGRGKFSAVVDLVEGRNKITVEVVDVLGRSQVIDSPTIQLDTKAPEQVIDTNPDMWKQ